MSAYISSGTRPRRSSVIALLIAAAVLYFAKEVLITLGWIALLLAIAVWLHHKYDRLFTDLL